MILLNRDLEPLGEVQPELEQPADEGHIVAKWGFEGCATLAELAERLRALAAEVETLIEEGWTLVDGPISGGHGLVRLSSAQSGKHEEG